MKTQRLLRVLFPVVHVTYFELGNTPGKPFFKMLMRLFTVLGVNLLICCGTVSFARLSQGSYFMWPSLARCDSSLQNQSRLIHNRSSIYLVAIYSSLLFFFCFCQLMRLIDLLTPSYCLFMHLWAVICLASIVAFFRINTVCCSVFLCSSWSKVWKREHLSLISGGFFSSC